MTIPKITITEDDLHAYVDGSLDAGRRLTVALYLVSAPADAARVEAFRAQKEAVQALFGDVVDEPPPPRLTGILRLRSNERALHRCLLVAAAAALGGLLLLAGGTLVQQLSPAARLRSPTEQGQHPADGVPLPVTLPQRRHGLDL